MKNDSKKKWFFQYILGDCFCFRHISFKIFGKGSLEFRRIITERAQFRRAPTSKMADAMCVLAREMNSEFSIWMRRNFDSSMPVAVGASSLSSLVTPDALENAAKEVDRQIAGDRQYPELAEQINVSQGKEVPLRSSSGYVKEIFFT